MTGRRTGSETLTRTCEAPPGGTPRCELHYTRGKHEPEEQPAEQPECDAIMLPDPS